MSDAQFWAYIDLLSGQAVDVESAMSANGTVAGRIPLAVENLRELAQSGVRQRHLAHVGLDPRERLGVGASKRVDLPRWAGRRCRS